MYTGVYGVERHHVFSHTSKEIELSEDYGFIAPLRPDLHPNGTRAGKNASKVDRYLRKRCKEYYCSTTEQKNSSGKNFTMLVRVKPLL